MRFKRVVGIVLVTLLLGLAAWGIYFFIGQKSTPLILGGDAKTTAKSFITEMSVKPDTAYQRLSENLKTNYSENYWKKDFFPRFAGQTDPKLLTAELLKDSVKTPSPYPPDVEAWQVVYQLNLNNRHYNLTIFVIKEKGTWKIDELNGNYELAS